MYAVTLFLHLVAVVSAFAASALIHLGIGRMRRADRVEQARDAVGIAERGGRLMPLVGLGLLATGAYLTHTAWTWSTPWIDVSIAGLVTLAIVGGRGIGAPLRAIGPRLARAGEGRLDGELAAALRAPALWTLSHVQRMLAVGVMLVMVTKPSLGVGIVELVAAVAVGILWAVPGRRVSAAGEAAATSSIARDVA